MTWVPEAETREALDLVGDFRQLRADIHRALWQHTICICVLNVVTFGGVALVLR